jgi:hypothetical protein
VGVRAPSLPAAVTNRSAGKGFASGQSARMAEPGSLTSDESATCGHPSPPVLPRVCAHLRDAREPWVNYYRCFTGRRFEHELLCVDCAGAMESTAERAAVAICAECLDRVLYEIGDQAGVRGTPEVLERPRRFPYALERRSIAGLPAPIIDADFASDGRSWVVLCGDGSVLRITDDWEAA